MIRCQAGVLALFALAANAFMIPSTMVFPTGYGDTLGEPLPDMPEMPEVHTPAISQPDNHFPGLTELLYGLEPTSVLLGLKCHSCSYPTDGVQMKFRLDQDRKHLLVNGQPIYPLDAGVLAPLELFLSTKAHGEELRSAQYQVGAEIEPLNAETSDKKIRVVLTVTALDEEPVSLSAVEIELLESENGSLFLKDANPVFDEEQPKSSPFHASSSMNDCNGPAFFCNMFSFFESKMAAWRSHLHRVHPCPGAARLHGPPITHGGIPKFLPYVPGHEQPAELDSQFEVHIRPHDEYTVPHHHHHHHHHSLHRFAMAVYNFLVGFAVPVLIGILAGMTASLVGMAAGTAVAWLWIRFVRKGKRGSYNRVRLDEQTILIDEDKFTGDDDAKVGLLEAEVREEAPPVYV